MSTQASQAGKEKAESSSATPRFCKDCAHFRYDTQSKDPATCDRVTSTDLVHGTPMRCDTARLRHGPCGPDATLFIARGVGLQ